jgi:hypothetical protein
VNLSIAIFIATKIVNNLYVLQQMSYKKCNASIHWNTTRKQKGKTMIPEQYGSILMYLAK